MKHTNTFQIIVIAIFAAFIIIGVAFFAFYRGDGSNESRVNLIVWGNMEERTFKQVINATSLGEDKGISIRYFTKTPETFDDELVEAIATGAAPDLFLLSSDSIVKHQNKIFIIPYKSYPLRTFKDNFIEAGELFLNDEGVIGLPFMIDPLVMYWNRDIFTNAELSTPPKYWDEFYDLSRILTKKSGLFEIYQSAVAIGEAQNVNNFKEILSALMIQAGTPIVLREQKSLKSALSESLERDIRPADAALNFYTQFSNPAKNFYSWNRSLPDSFNFFLSNSLGVYFGFASELSQIRAKNPNLNFDITYFPQSRDAKIKSTFAKVYAFAVPKLSKNITTAVKVAYALSSADALKELGKQTNLPPVRRDLLQTHAPDDVGIIFNNSALYARGWLDPNSNETDKIFQEMISSVTSGKSDTSHAVGVANGRLDLILKNP